MNRRAFTLMELLLVLALIVVIGALMTPFINRAFQNQRLRYAANQLRADWLKARNTAMKSGRIHMFRYEPESGQYRLQAWVAENDALEASAIASTSDTANPASSTAAATNLDVLSGADLAGTRELPGDTTFVDSQVFDDSRAAAVDPGAEPVSATGAGPWSRPILFYPDGSTSSARVAVKNENYYIMLSLRGLTGSAVASDLLTLEEVSNAAQQ